MLNDSVINQLKTVALITKLCVVISIVLLCFGLFWLIVAYVLNNHITHLLSDFKDEKLLNQNEA